MGFVITGCANLMILGEIPSYPVAFLMFNLFICLVTKSSFIGLKNNLSLFVLFVSIQFYSSNTNMSSQISSMFYGVVIHSKWLMCTQF
jgi:hypothetical protein